MTPELRRLRYRFCIISAVTSVATHPIPAVDELFVVLVHYRFSLKFARAQNVRIRDIPWRQVNKVIWGGAGVRFCFDLGFGLVPIAGSLCHALTAIALTDYLSRYLDKALSLPHSPPPPVTLRDIRDSIRRRVPLARQKRS
jgi:hypothetical protein